MDTVELGAFAQPIAKQFPELPTGLALLFDDERRCIIKLVVRGLLTQKQADAARKRLAREIGRHVRDARTATKAKGV